MPNTEKVKRGDTLHIYDFRDNLIKSVKALEDEIFNDDQREVYIRFLNGDKHYAVFNKDTNRWESGEM